MWQQVSTAPFDRDLELAVIDDDGPHALVFPCRRILNGWMKVETKERLDVRPTHWREWPASGAGRDNSPPPNMRQA
jgi:hypothetical protein